MVNLDAAGSGGRELLFQSGPNYSWLVDVRQLINDYTFLPSFPVHLQYYNKFAKHPFGTTLAEEIYQSGALPSDSDYTIFKEHIPGTLRVQDYEITKLINFMYAYRIRPGSMLQRFRIPYQVRRDRRYSSRILAEHR